MESTVSVSKGVFVFKNGLKAASKKSRKKSKPSETLFCDSLWYTTYKDLWNYVESQIQELNNDIFSNVLGNLVNYVHKSYENPVSEIPAAVLLTGINMPDHGAQFKTLKQELRGSVTPHIAVLNGEDCQNLKYLVEILINQLVRSEAEGFNEDSSDEEGFRHVKKSQCNFALLQAWYEEQTNKNPIVVVIPDFENFTPKVLQDFISIIAGYVNILPFVFVFGVATSLSAVHRTLPYHVSSKVNIQVFHSSPSTVHLNNVLENILFSRDCPFHLGGKIFNLFTDIFLFYDLSVSGFIQNFKYAMLEHFSFGNVMGLCRRKNHKLVLGNFTHEDCENARHLLSFRRLVEGESAENRIKLLTDDDFFRNVLRAETKKMVKYLGYLHLFLKCLHALVRDLPKAPLGKQLRELYAVVVSKNVTTCQEYKECFQLLSFQSRQELTAKLQKIEFFLVNNPDQSPDEMAGILANYLRKLKDLDSDSTKNLEIEKKELIPQQIGRKQLKETLLQMSKQSKPMNKYEKLRAEILDLLSKQFELYLVDPKSYNFHEIFFFDDVSIQSHIVGSHRAAIHTALNDPHYYLQCSCCGISNDSVILSSMPAISIVYKLHLECGKMINLYDWLQSYLSIVDPQDVEDGEKPRVDPRFQARFTQAVAELEFLGFIKSSKHKTDHVARLTWGG